MSYSPEVKIYGDPKAACAGIGATMLVTNTAALNPQPPPICPEIRAPGPRVGMN
jgi:hypothetical protein